MYHFVHQFHTRYNVPYTYYIPTHIPAGYIVYACFTPAKMWKVPSVPGTSRVWKFEVLDTRAKLVCSKVDTTKKPVWEFFKCSRVTPRGAGSSQNNCPPRPRVVILGNSRLRAAINRTCKFLFPMIPNGYKYIYIYIYIYIYRVP